MKIHKDEMGKRIREIRKRLNIDQDELGRLTGTSKQSVSSYETGRSFPPLDFLASLAKIGDVTVDQIVTGAEMPNQKQGSTAPPNRGEIAATIQPGNDAAARKLEEANRRPSMRNPLLRQVVSWMDEYFDGDLEAQAFYFHDELRRNHPSFAAFVERNRPAEFTREEDQKKETRAASA